MWLITQTGFISLVQDRKDPSKVWVRARIKEDIAKTFPTFADQIVTKIGADYIYRLVIPKDVAAAAMWNAVQDIDYDSHAKEVMNRRSHPHPKRMSAYYKIWNALAELQPFAPFQRHPRTVPGVSVVKTSAPVGGQMFSAAPDGSWHRNQDFGHYDWDRHPQSTTYRGATGFRNGQPIESYPAAAAVDTAVDLDTADLSGVSDEDLFGIPLGDEDFDDLVAKREDEHTGPTTKKRNARRRANRHNQKDVK